MLVELVAGQFALESALADVANADPAVRDQLRTQLSLVAGLRQQIGTAQGSALSMLRAEVSTIASNAVATAQDARTSALANASGANSIAALASAARQQTNAVMAGMKDFDPYLKFASPDDEAEYRKREDQRRQQIAQEQAKGTVEGDQNAAHLAIAQMKDAGAHGADKSPLFKSRFDALTQASQSIDNAAAKNHSSDMASPDRSSSKVASSPKSPDSLQDAMAALQAAGVQSSTGDGHGVVAAAAGRGVATSGRA